MFPKWQSILQNKHLYLKNNTRSDSSGSNDKGNVTTTTTTATATATATTTTLSNGINNNNNNNNNNNDDKKPKLNLIVLKNSCLRTQKYCLSVERFMYYLFTLELLFTIIIIFISAFRVNPYLLRMIVGKRDLRAHQPVAITAFSIARYLRNSMSISILFDVIGGVNCLLLIFDLLCGLYLWRNATREILSIINDLDKQVLINTANNNPNNNTNTNNNNGPDSDNIEESTTIRNILNTLCVLPISSYGYGRYYLWNRYKPSQLIEKALGHLDQVQKQVEIEYEQFLTEKKSSSSSNDALTTIKDVNYYFEVEALRNLHAGLSKAKPFELQNLEQVLDLITPVYVLWLVNLYMIFAGWPFIYIFGVLTVAAIVITIWYKLSMNVAFLTPIVVPLVIVLTELGSFMLVSGICLLSHWSEYYLSLLIIPLNLLIVYSLCWEQKKSFSSPLSHVTNSQSSTTNSMTSSSSSSSSSSSHGNKLD